MNTEILDSAIKFGAGRYIQDTDVLEKCGEEIKRFGKKAFVIAGKRAFEAVEEKMIAGFEKANLEYEINIYTGTCSYEAAENFAKKCKELGCDEIVGVGGGVIMDLAKAIGEFAKVGVVNIPTSFATCAAFTTMSIMYDESGKKINNWRFEKEVDAVLIDMDVIVNCPSRYACAGILDAMAKKIEISNGRSEMLLENTSVDLFSAYIMAQYTYDVLFNNTKQVIEDINNKKVTKLVYDFTFLCIGITGVLANTTKSFRQAALAHSIYDAIRTFFTEEGKNSLHGEIVAVGLFTQLHYNNLSSEKSNLKNFMLELGMPLTLSELGVEGSEENLNILEQHLIKTPFVDDTREKLELIHEAMKQML